MKWACLLTTQPNEKLHEILFFLRSSFLWSKILEIVGTKQVGTQNKPRHHKEGTRNKHDFCKSQKGIGGTVLVRLCWWNSVDRTVLVELCWWNIVGETLLVEHCKWNIVDWTVMVELCCLDCDVGSVLVEHCYFNNVGGTVHQFPQCIPPKQFKTFIPPFKFSSKTIPPTLNFLQTSRFRCWGFYGYPIFGAYICSGSLLFGM